MKPNPFEVSDGITKLKRLFEKHPSGCQMNDAGVVMIIDKLETVRKLALQLEHEVSRLRWNAAAKSDAGTAADVIKASATEPNVVLFMPAFKAFVRSSATPQQPEGAA